jgi:hypothetical protein
MNSCYPKSWIAPELFIWFVRIAELSVSHDDALIRDRALHNPVANHNAICKHERIRR